MSQSTNINAAGKLPCYCQCGALANQGANYLRGHDARHAGKIARLLAATPDTGTWNDIAFRKLPSLALARKALSAAEKIVAREAQKAKLRGPDYAVGEIKIGRWTYPTRIWENGVVQRNEKRDGTGGWVTL